MSSDTNPIVSQSQFYAEVIALMRDLHGDGELSNLDLAEITEADLVAQSVWELGFDSALVIELAIFVEDLGVELPDDLPWASLTIDDLYSAYLYSRVDHDLQQKPS